MAGVLPAVQNFFGYQPQPVYQPPYQPVAPVYQPGYQQDQYGSAVQQLTQNVTALQTQITNAGQAAYYNQATYTQQIYALQSSVSQYRQSFAANPYYAQHVATLDQLSQRLQQLQTYVSTPPQQAYQPQPVYQPPYQPQPQPQPYYPPQQPAQPYYPPQQPAQPYYPPQPGGHHRPRHRHHHRHHHDQNRQNPALNIIGAIGGIIGAAAQQPQYRQY